MKLQRIIAAVLSLTPSLAQGPARFEAASVRTIVQSPEEAIADFHRRHDDRARTHRLSAFASAAIVVHGTHVDTDGIVMRDLIAAAYGEDPALITAPGMPGVGRLSQVRYAIHAIMPEGGARAQLPEMLRALLEERFQLRVHRADVEHEGYALSLRKGAELRPAREMDRSQCESWVSDPSFAGAEMCRTVQTIGGRNAVVNMRSDSSYGPWESRLENNSFRTEFFHITMPQLAQYLTSRFSIVGFQAQDSLFPVIDRTGLKGAYDITIEGTPTDPTNFTSWFPDRDAGPAVDYSTALGKVGLKLDHAKAPVEELLIDHIEMRPTEN